MYEKLLWSEYHSFFCFFMVKRHFALKRANLVRSTIQNPIFYILQAESDVHSVNGTA